MQVNNVLLDELPEEWNGYRINTWFQIGIQLTILMDDMSIVDFEKTALIINLLFDDREHPNGDDLKECIAWYMGGWCHDNSPSKKEKRRLIDYDIDQWRIYADFLQIYGINLNESDMHWWEFNGLLWNMPYKTSSFLQVIDIRKKKIKAKMSKEEKAAISEAQHIYGLSQRVEKPKFTKEEESKIDAYDEMMRKAKENKAAMKKFLEEIER